MLTVSRGSTLASGVARFCAILCIPNELWRNILLILRLHHVDLLPSDVHLHRHYLQHPAMVYLASLAPGSRRGVRSSLQVCRELLSSGRCDWQTLPWWALGPQHTQALRSELADRYAAP